MGEVAAIDGCGFARFFIIRNVVYQKYSRFGMIQSVLWDS